MSLPKERNYNFEQEISEIAITPKGNIANKKLTLYKYKAKALLIKLKLQK